MEEITMKELQKAADMAGLEMEFLELRNYAESLRHIAVIAHCGGLCRLSEADALRAIRRFSLAAWDKSENEEHLRKMVRAAIRAAAVGAA